MRLPWFILFFILVPFISFAQYGTISGKITHAGTPLPRASVFLSNSSVGSASQEDGSFVLSGIRPGQYTLIVTILGYEDYSKTILVTREPIRLNIQMTPKPLMLREVVISSAADWKRNYEQFRKEFIGSDQNAKQCNILNPHILNLTYNQTKQILHADADEFLVIENKALGYRVKFLVRDFNVDKIAQLVTFGGERMFEDLPGSESQKKIWHQRREEAYYGSSMHFYRSLYANTLSQEGFIMYRLYRMMNPRRPSDNDIRRLIGIYKNQGKIDSIKYLIEVSKESKYTNEKLLKPALDQFEVLNVYQPGIYALHFKDCLYVVYTKKTDDTPDKDLYRPLDQPNYAVSVLTETGPYALFDSNGIMIENSPFTEGAWSRNRLSDLLPVDYVPDQK